MPKNSSALDSVIHELTKKYGEKGIFGLAKDLRPPKAFPTYLFPLDEDLGGGWLWGKINIVSGKEASGKTSICYRTVGNFQKLVKDPVVVWWDVEKQFDAERAALLGVDPDKIVVFSGLDMTMEFLYESLRTTIKELRGKNCLFVVDSIAATEIEKLIEEDLVSHTMQSSAKQINQLIKVTNVLLAHNQILLLVNQLRDKMDSRGDPNYMPGGNAQRYLATNIIETRQAEVVREGTYPVGQKFNYTIKKSRSSNPKETGTLDFDYQKGFVTNAQLIEVAANLGILEKRGGWYVLPEGITTPDGSNKIQGSGAFVELLANNPEFLVKLQDSVYKLFKVPSWFGEENAE